MTHRPWTLYYHTHEAWGAMLQAIHNATESIDFEQFYLSPDIVGKLFIDALVAKSKAGVRVRLLVDTMGSFPFSTSMYPDALLYSGADVRFFNWLRPFSQGNQKMLYFRNHRRSLIIDGKIGFTGGACISSKMRHWRETQVKIEGEAIGEMQHAFEQMWHVASKRKWKLNKDSRKVFDGFQYVTHSPLPRQRYLYYRLIEAIRNAKKSIYISNPYFVPDHRLMRVLRLARRRGVDVQILVPNGSNHAVVDVASHSYFHQILVAGIRIHQYNEMIHAKTVVIDNDWSFVGSLNMDNISLKYNFESGIISTTKEFAEELKQQFFEDALHAKEVNLEDWSKRPLARKVLEKIVWPIRLLL